MIADRAYHALTAALLALALLALFLLDGAVLR